MPTAETQQLATLLQQEQLALLAEWRKQVRQLPSAQQLDTPTLNDHIPMLLEELISELEIKSDQTIPDALQEVSSLAHGLQRVEDGYDILEVVAEFNILRGCIHDLSTQHGLNLQGEPFHILNRVLDQAIGMAVATFSSQRALEVQRRREEYLTFVAHDLRTPLNAISLAVSILEISSRRQVVSAETAQLHNSLRRNVQQLAALVNKVIDENTNLQSEEGIQVVQREFDLWSLVESLVQDLSPVAETAGTKLNNEIPHEQVLFADASLLRRVFQNLIANAIRYTPNGVVRIGVNQTMTNGMVECWVCDNGTGMSSEVIEKVFDKGVSDPENDEGSGLGLAIVKSFIEAHEGSVSVESQVGAGSTFRFTLPVPAPLASLEQN